MSMIELVMQRYVFYMNDTNTLCFLTCQRPKKRLRSVRQATTTKDTATNGRL